MVSRWTQTARRTEDRGKSGVLAFSYCHVSKTASRKRKGFSGLTASEVWSTQFLLCPSQEQHHGEGENGGNASFVAVEGKRNRKRTSPTTSIPDTPVTLALCRATSSATNWEPSPYDLLALFQIYGLLTLHNVFSA